MENTNIIIKDERELLSFLESQLKIKHTGYKWILEVENKVIDFELYLPLSKSAKNSLSVKIPSPIEQYSFSFKNCEFRKDIYVKDETKAYSDGTKTDVDESSIEYSFTECEFNNETIRIGNTTKNINFWGDKKFTKKLDLEDSDLTGKIRFRKCQFNEVDFHNTKFNDLADFWMCTFHKPVIFYKTDFYGNAVFSGATFKENALFTYTLIEKVIIFRGTTFEKGLDLSTAILSGTLSYFDVKLGFYKSKKEFNDKGNYESLISELAEIPILNKRETFRIIKKNYENVSNNVEALKIKKLEMRTLFDESHLKLFSGVNVKESTSNLFLLFWNLVSNFFGISYLQGTIFTLLIGFIFFYLSILQTNLFEFSFSFNKITFIEGLKYYVQFLLPTHRFDYLGIETKYDNYYYVFDFLGRIFVGYGFYQTIQSFRKFR